MALYARTRYLLPHLEKAIVFKDDLFQYEVTHLRRFASNSKETSTGPTDSYPHEKQMGAHTEIPLNLNEKRDPFVKNLFRGKFDHSLLTFPEILDKGQLDTLNEMVVPIQKYFEEKVDSKAIDTNAEIPKETLQGLKELGLFGLQVPEEYGGLDLNATECTRIGEITSLDGGIAVTLAAHQAIGFKGILLFGTDAQKEKYLPKLASGEHTAAFCLTEPLSGSDAASISTKATLSGDNSHYLLNGGKIWISNGGIADIFTVFAKTDHKNEEGETEEKVTAFIVERAFGGVTNGKPEDKLGIRGSNTSQLFFENTKVPVENVLDVPGKGFKVAMKILNGGRFSMGGAVAGILKHVIKPAAEYAVNRSQFKTQLKDFPLIQEKFARMTINAYVMESMSYLTAGLIDSQTDGDCSVEAAIVKVFSSEKGFECVNDCIQVFGGMGYMKDFPYERFMRDGRILHIFEGTNEILRLFISLNGLQHISAELKQMVKKLRNPLMNPRFVLKQAKKNIGPFFRRTLGMDPKLNLDLQGSAHPALKYPCKNLELSVKLFESAVQKALSDHGAGIQNKQLTLKRIADMAIDLYAMTAVIARASRSCIIGLRNCDLELRIVDVFVTEAKDRIDVNYEEIMEGPFSKMDGDIIKVAEAVFKNYSVSEFCDAVGSKSSSSESEYSPSDMFPAGGMMAVVLPLRP